MRESKTLIRRSFLMKKWKLGKLAVATGIAAMALAFSGVIEPAGAGNETDGYAGHVQKP